MLPASLCSSMNYIMYMRPFNARTHETSSGKYVNLFKASRDVRQHTEGRRSAVDVTVTCVGCRKQGSTSRHIDEQSIAAQSCETVTFSKLSTVSRLL